MTPKKGPKMTQKGPKGPKKLQPRQKIPLETRLPLEGDLYRSYMTHMLYLGYPQKVLRKSKNDPQNGPLLGYRYKGTHVSEHARTVL